MRQRPVRRKQASLHTTLAGEVEYNQTDPANAEHFGIAVTEAMSLGVIPVVLRKGGLPEVVLPGTGFVSTNLEMLVALTRKVLRMQPSMRTRMGQAAAHAAARFTSFNIFAGGYTALAGALKLRRAQFTNGDALTNESLHAVVHAGTGVGARGAVCSTTLPPDAYSYAGGAGSATGGRGRPRGPNTTAREDNSITRVGRSSEGSPSNASSPWVKHHARRVGRAGRQAEHKGRHTRRAVGPVEKASPTP